MKADKTLQESKRLQRQVESGRRKLIEGEFALAGTLCDLAETECRLHSYRHAAELAAKARQAAETIHRIVQHATLPPPERDAIHRKLLVLEARFRELDAALLSVSRAS